MLKTRIVTAVFLLAGLLGALFFLPRTGWAAFCTLICAAGAWEWGALAGWKAAAKIAYAVVLGSLCFVLAVCLKWDGSRLADDGAAAFVAALDFLAIAFWLLAVPPWLNRQWHLSDFCAVLTGGIVLLPPMLVFIGLRDFGPLAVLLAAAPVWVADVAAYFSGRAFGRKKLAPSISPGKTWAGAFGAVLGVALYGVVVFVVAMPERVSVPALAVVLASSVGLAALSIVGDLFESLLKRQAGVKDSGRLLPGHGGVLDRVDSLTSTLPLWPVLLPVFMSIAGPS